MKNSAFHVWIFQSVVIFERGVSAIERRFCSACVQVMKASWAPEEIHGDARLIAVTTDPGAPSRVGVTIVTGNCNVDVDSGDVAGLSDDRDAT
ncbi:hypothetical protein [Rhodococcus wratislaviensis]|uniref:hypothetical protein n=1 Tax=Rhodococcus wratislaviensis TaxID=44752 RepID=UPI000F56FA71|nr:hypothetical protein [Rhodococcus wratislaviensis]